VNPSTFGQAVVFNVTVSPSGSSTQTPTGTVTFLDGNLILQTDTLVGGAASFTTAALPIGINSISVVYSGDGTYATSTSTPISQTVNAPTVAAISVLIGPTSAVTAQTLTAAASVSAASNASTIGPVAKIAKKATVTKKALPNGGSSTKFHQSAKTANVKRTVAVATKHVAKPSAKQAKPSVKLAKIVVKKK
jgi:large repetitive protein